MKRCVKVLFLILLFFSAFVLRAVLTTYINKGDVLVVNEWSKSLYVEGMSGSYFRQGWIYSFPTQPPPMMILFWVSRWLYENKYVLSILHNITKFPPTFVLLWIHENGPLFSVKLWGIIGDCLSALVIYFVIKRTLKNRTTAFLAAFFILFNPILIFESSIWGQTDILASLLAILSFLTIFYNKKVAEILSPVFFIIGISLKPSILVLFPLYLAFLAKKFILNSAKEKKSFALIIAGFILAMGLLIFSFVLFWDKSLPFFKYTKSIVEKRIIPSAKGTIKAATSAYNFHTVFFEIDKTLGNQKLGPFTLTQTGNILIAFVNLLALPLFLIKKKNFAFELSMLLFLVYCVGEGAFLFRTGMAERYFFPSFLFLYLLFFMVKDAKIKLAIVLQFLLWFINLLSSFFLRDYSFLDVFFRQNNYFGTRLFSLMNVLIYIFIVVRFLKHTSYDMNFLTDEK